MAKLTRLRPLISTGLIFAALATSTALAQLDPINPREVTQKPIVLKSPPGRTITIPALPATRDCEDKSSDDCAKKTLPLPVDPASRKEAIRKHMTRSTTTEPGSSSIVVGPDQAVISGKVLRNGLWPVAGAEIFFKGVVNGQFRLLPVNGTTEINVVSADDGSYTAVIGNENYDVPEYVIMSVFADDHFVYYHDNVHDRNEERAVPIPLSPGSQIDGLNAAPFGESNAIMFWGVIEDTDGQPIPGIAVVPYIDGKSFLPLRHWDANSDSNGRFAVLLPPSGQTATLELLDKRDHYEGITIEDESWVLSGTSQIHVGAVVLQRKLPAQ
jgi:hypothetical protein